MLNPKHSKLRATDGGDGGGNGEGGDQWVVTGGGEVAVDPVRSEARAIERRVTVLLARNSLARTVRCVVRQVRTLYCHFHISDSY